MLRSKYIFTLLVSCLFITVGPFYQRGMTKAQNEKILITAQKNPGEVQKGSSEETVLKERAVDESAREEISDADRIISLQITIAAEEENLEKLKKELKERQAAFDNASNSLKDLTRKREKKQK
ncbi:MAG: hypothetical protein ACTSVS_02905, partial [Candidatus Heimdallarchaeota archaeon]